MARFRKKPVEIEARQLGPNNPGDIVGWVTQNGGNAFMRGGPGGGSKGGTVFIVTLEGTHRADQGDWIIRGVAGEFYPCKPDIFDATYEPVETPAFTQTADCFLHGRYDVDENGVGRCPVCQLGSGPEAV